MIEDDRSDTGVSKVDPGIKERYESLLSEWKEYMKRPEVKVQSSLERRVDCEAYKEIIALGAPVLPLLFETMKKGNGFMWYAARDITGVDLAPERMYCGRRLSDPEIANMYLEWWDTEGRHKFCKEESKVCEDAGSGSGVSEMDREIRARYKKLLSEWHTYWEEEAPFQSDPERIIDCDPYRQIIGLNKPVLPYLFEDMRSGDFMLWYAAKEITGVDLVPGKRIDGRLLGEDEIAEAYVNWWDAEGKDKFGTKRGAE